MMCTWGVPRNPKQNDCFQTMADRHTTVNKRMMRYVRLVKKKTHTHKQTKKSRFAGTFETKTVRPPVKNYPRYPSLQKQKKNIFLEKMLGRSSFCRPHLNLLSPNCPSKSPVNVNTPMPVLSTTKRKRTAAGDIIWSPSPGRLHSKKV